VSFNINKFSGAMAFGGARNTLFSVNITNPVNGTADIQVPFMVKAGQIPASTLGTIELPYFGRKVKIAGDRTYAEWTTTILNDEDFGIRNAMEEWSYAINTPITNLRQFGSASPSEYKADAQITQYSKTGVAVRTYNFVGLWPQEVSTIELAWDSNDQVEEFTVTFAYDYWEIQGGITSNAGVSKPAVWT
tara:strand:- start:15011 stop:15580 length:570 start_codon:yes stop_codon:yes gene_type:complete